MKTFSHHRKIGFKILTAITLITLMLCPVASSDTVTEPERQFIINSVCIKESLSDLLNQDFLTVHVDYCSQNINQALFVCSDTSCSEILSINNILYIDQLDSLTLSGYDYKIPLEKIDALNVKDGKKTLYLQFGAVELDTPVQYTFTFDAFEIYNVCDINHDRAVDSSDIEALQASAYYGLPASSESAKKLDVNQDGFINIIDIAEISLEISDTDK